MLAHKDRDTRGWGLSLNPNMERFALCQVASEKVLKKIFFTLFHLDENVEFANRENYGKNPNRSSDAFHS